MPAMEEQINNSKPFLVVGYFSASTRELNILSNNAYSKINSTMFKSPNSKWPDSQTRVVKRENTLGKKSIV